jgi:hypothetical protein
MFNKLERQKKVLMAPLLHHQQRRLQQQEIQHKELDKIKSRRGKAKAALSFIVSPTAMDCLNVLPLFHLL